ncbi:MAG: hypothetical protein F4W93_13565 [Dehalococcoidia bacterium]|nr:hypothetical protein [Dehalococcoidia bacterium]
MSVSQLIRDTGWFEENPNNREDGIIPFVYRWSGDGRTIYVQENGEDFQVYRGQAEYPNNERLRSYLESQAYHITRRYYALRGEENIRQVLLIIEAGRRAGAE